MVDHYRNTEVGQHLQRRASEEAKESMLLALLQRRFGDTPEASVIVQRLAGWSDGAAMGAILNAPDIETLLTAEPPS